MNIEIINPILIVGAARSGTSMVARLIHEAGAWKGSTNDGNDDNLFGFFENNWIRDGFVKTFLGMSGYDPLGVDPLPPAEFSQRDGMGEMMLNPIIPQLIVNDGYKGGAPWFYKDAKLALMWKHWHKAFPNAKWVVVDRGREATIESCLRTKFMNELAEDERDEQFWINWVDAYLERIEDLKKEVNYMEVKTTDVVNGDLSTIQKAIEFCELKWNPIKAQSSIRPEVWGKDKKPMHRLKLNMGMNLEESQILDNVKYNIRRQLPQAKTYEINEQRIAIVGGGPSLHDTLDELKAQVKEGVKLVAVNNTHDWLIENGLKPSVHIMVDARPHNARFVQNPIKSCKYMMASQCDPSVFDALEGYNTHIFHVVNELGEKEILDNYYFGKYFFVVGGSTVMLRGIWLMRMLGFVKIDLYGFDSCYMDGEHHAYKQVENDECEVRELVCMGKTFQCAAWMASQFDDFQHFVMNLGDKFELNVHGNGLIAHMMNEGAKLLDDDITATGGT